MKDPDLTIAAYVDGELDAADRARVESEMIRDPSFADAVAAERRLRARLAAAYDPVLSEPVPARLAMIAEAANDPPARRSPVPPWNAVPPWAAVAASLVAGVLVGRLVGPPETGPLVAESGSLVASGALARVLDEGLAADAGPIRVGLSFQAKDGRYCRTFQSAPDRLAGLACRQDDRWQARTLTAWAPADAAYRTASSGLPPEILASVETMMSGDPLDAEGERAARERRWDSR